MKFINFKDRAEIYFLYHLTLITLIRKHARLEMKAPLVYVWNNIAQIYRVVRQICIILVFY